MKKILALVVAFVLCFTAVAGCFTATAEDAAVPTITIEAPEVAPNGEVSIAVKGENMESVDSYLLTVVIPEGFTGISIPALTEVVEGGNGGDYVVKGNTVKTLNEIAALADKGLYADGEFNLVITATAPEAEGTYTPSAVVDAGNSDAQSVEVTVVAKDIVVKAPVVEPPHEHEWTYTYDVVDGVCVTTATCACEETKTIEITNTNLSQAPCLNADLSAYFVIPASAVSAYTDLYATFEKDGYENDGTFVTLNNFEETTSNGTPVVQVLYEGITSKQMSNNIDCRIYGTDADGNVVLIAQEDWSMKDYIELAYNTYVQYPAYAKLTTLIVDLANYGAQSQKTFGYNTDNLVNANIPQDLASELPTEFTDVAVKEGVNISYGPDLSNKVIVTMNIATSALNDGDTLEVAYTAADGSSATETYTYVAEDGVTTWSVAFDKLTAPTLYTDFTAVLYNGETSIGSVTGSIEAYAGVLKQYPAYESSYKATQYLLAYSYSADAYF